MRLSRVAEADGGVALAEALTLADAKTHLNVLHTTDDAYIGSLCRVAQARLEGADGTGGILARAVTRHMLLGRMEAFPPGRRIIELPQPPLVSVAWIKYRDTADVEQTFPASSYVVIDDAVRPFVRLHSAASWPTTFERADAVTIRFTVGPDAVPDDLLAALKLHVGHLYVNREVALEKSLTAMPMGYESLISPHKAHGWI